MKHLVFTIILKGIILFCIKHTPILILRLAFKISYRYSGTFTCKLLKIVPLNKLSQLNCDFINKAQIISSSAIKKYRYHLIADEEYESVRTPDIMDISKNNFVRLRRHEISLYLFENASFSTKSDIINLPEGVYWEKANRKEFSQMIPADDNFISVDIQNNFVYYISQKDEQDFNVGFSLCGVHTNAWAHFVLNSLPKLMSISHINEKIVLILPDDIHEHHKGMVNLFIEENFSDRNIQIKNVRDKTRINVKRLYYCNTVSFLTDSAYLVHPASACISKYGSLVTAKFLKFLHTKVPISKSRKLYIGRGPTRNLTNAPEIEKYFKDKGFEIIYPHLLSLDEKIEIFGNATHICGPVSSGFANFIFCKNKVKILGFFNYARAFDPFISGLNYAGNLGHEILFVTGYEPPNLLINNSYYIDLDSIRSACKEISFLDRTLKKPYYDN